MANGGTPAECAAAAYKACIAAGGTPEQCAKLRDALSGPGAAAGSAAYKKCIADGGTPEECAAAAYKACIAAGGTPEQCATLRDALKAGGAGGADAALKACIAAGGTPAQCQAAIAAASGGAGTPNPCPGGMVPATAPPGPCPGGMVPTGPQAGLWGVYGPWATTPPPDPIGRQFGAWAIWTTPPVPPTTTIPGSVIVEGHTYVLNAKMPPVVAPGMPADAGVQAASSPAASKKSDAGESAAAQVGKQAESLFNNIFR